MSLSQLAQDVLNLLERGFYETDGQQVSIAAQQQRACDDSRLYSPDDLTALRGKLPQGDPAQIEVMDATTQQAAQTLVADGPLVLLNFASARNPGGGFLGGAKAQEEDLCRCSGLYPTLLPHIEYYEVNRAQKSLLYTDYAIYSPGVPFFKHRGTGELLAEPFTASVITMPAPNSRPYLKRDGDPRALEECFERRWRNVLAIAYDQNISTILLGAWGCGAFGGDPEMASRTARRALDDFAPAFERIIFAIPGRGKQSQRNLDVFRQQFSQA